MYNKYLDAKCYFIAAKYAVETFKIKKSFAQAVIDLDQPDPQRDSPEIVILPQESIVQEAVQKIKNVEPSYFVGVKEIRVENTGESYGKTESGPGKDPSIIYLNSEKIKRDIQSKTQGLSEEDRKKVIVDEVASTITHEKGHILPFKQTKQLGSEQQAEMESERMQPKLKAASKQ